MRFLSIPLTLFLTFSAHAAQDYSNQDLHGKDFQNEALKRSRFDGANLESANFQNAALTDASFRNARMQRANLQGANLEGADFTGADLGRANFYDAKAWRAKLNGAHIDLVILVDYSKVNDFRAQQTLIANARTNCGHLSFRYAELRNASLVGNAEGVDFKNADLRGADLSLAEHLDKAFLRGAKYDETTRWNVAPEKAGAVLFKEQAAPPEAAGIKSPLVGKWLILKGEEGALDNGTLVIRANKTFEWDTALSSDTPKVLKGTWQGDDKAIVLKGGELQQDWTATLVSKSGRNELHLRSDKDVKRVAVEE